MDSYLGLPGKILIGAAGLVSLGYGLYYSITRTDSMHRNDGTGQKKICVKRSESAPSTLGSHWPQKDQMSDITNTAQLVFRMENKFFSEIVKKASLTPKQFSVLKKTSSVLIFPELDVDKVHSLYDILSWLRDTGYLKPGFYKINILHILNTARLEVSDDLRKYLDRFEETIQDILGKGSTRQEDRVDAVIIYSDENRQEAIKVFKDLQENLTNVPDMKIVLHEELDSNTAVLSGVDAMLSKCNYMFIIVTTALKKDDLKRYLVEIGLIQCLEEPNPVMKWKIVPVWMDKRAKDVDHCPCELSPLKGVQYWYYLEDASDVNKGLLFGHFEKIILAGRKKFKLTRVHSVT